VEENALFLQKKYTKPLPHQNHMAHLQELANFEMSPWNDQITPQGKQLIQMHKQETLSLAYLVAKQQEEEQAKALAVQTMIQEAVRNGTQQGGMERMADSAPYIRSIEKIGGASGGQAL